ncbi:MAG TPA: GerAB/ArcD/ProY family transporter [Firmicutes bacterium]|nr:GerAB/ArcD/ProY family transporter [Bacillota bacterium]
MKLNSRQILFFLAAVAPVGKLILMPAQLAAACDNDLLFPVAAQLLLQAALVFCVLLLARREKTFYRLICDAAGGVCARIASVALAAFLLFAAFLPVVEQKILVRGIFYDTIPAYLVFTPFFLFSAYLCARPLVTLGRMWDILAPLSVIGTAGILLLSVGSADYGALAPAGAAGIQAFWGGTAATFGWFYDTALLLSLIGRFGYTKGLAWKGALCYLAGGGVLLFFLATFYGVFSEIAVIQPHAFARMSGFFSGMTVLGRIDYLFIFAVAFVMTFYAVFPMQSAVNTVSEAFGDPKPLAPLLSVGVNLGMLAAVYLSNFHTSQAITTVTQTLFWLFPVFTVLLPLLLLIIFGRRPHEKVS